MIGGAAVLALFGDVESVAFGFYGFGLAVGFFGYFLVLLAFVAKSPSKTVDFFLGTNYGVRPMLTDGPKGRQFDPPL